MPATISPASVACMNRTLMTALLATLQAVPP
jgi:hypothetical protein